VNTWCPGGGRPVVAPVLHIAMETAIVVFTRDLRLHDNPALHLACSRARQVVPLFVEDPAIPAPPNRARFLAESLADLRQQLRCARPSGSTPAGDCVRRYVPELAGLPPARIHTPWRLDPAARRRLGYPGPLADLS
jgi:deoxyribodipyrimidine photo-lyase